MLSELLIRDLGVIDELSLLFKPGMTAVTGETGAGKTLILDAVNLLTGGRADSGKVRPGADIAEVQGRFIVRGVVSTAPAQSGGSDQPMPSGRAEDASLTGGAAASDQSEQLEEIVVRRVIPRSERSRCYVNGRLATLRSLAELGRSLVEIHAQNSHQALLQQSSQRAAIDRFGGVDTAALTALKLELNQIDEAINALGGDERARAREIDLLRYQLDEIDSAGIEGPDEDERLDAAEAVMAEASAHQDAAREAIELLNTDRPAADGLNRAIAVLADRAPFTEPLDRLADAEAEIIEAVAELRVRSEAINDDPAALASLRERRQQLAELRRKYGESLQEVIDFYDSAAQRLAELENRGQQAAVLEEQRAETAEALAAEQALVREARQAAAPRLAASAQARLQGLAMAGARIEIGVGGTAGEQVQFRLAANPGHEPIPLARAASGGELSRVMLALRLVIGTGPPTLVFDEVDTGIGGAAARAVGSSLAALTGQVLVVTHLAQVAAYADHHLMVEKPEAAAGCSRSATVRSLSADQRVVEISRMLSGSPLSDTAQSHAEELLADIALHSGADDPDSACYEAANLPLAGRQDSHGDPGRRPSRTQQPRSPAE